MTERLQHQRALARMVRKMTSRARRESTVGVAINWAGKCFTLVHKDWFFSGYLPHDKQPDLKYASENCTKFAPAAQCNLSPESVINAQNNWIWEPFLPKCPLHKLAEVLDD